VGGVLNRRTQHHPGHLARLHAAQQVPEGPLDRPSQPVPERGHHDDSGHHPGHEDCPDDGATSETTSSRTTTPPDMPTTPPPQPLCAGAHGPRQTDAERGDTGR